MVFFTSSLQCFKLQSSFLSLAYHPLILSSFLICDLSFSQSMGNFCLIACLSRAQDDEIVGATEAEDPKFVCRDGLNKKPSHIKASVPSGTHHGREQSSKQIVGSTGGVKRVKIRLTKQEASLLLSNCKVEEGLLKFKLSQLQTIGTTCTTTPADRPSWNPSLQSISEE